MTKGNCEFNGSGRQYLGVFIMHIFLLSMLTLGIYAPWAWVRLLRLRASHTRINGKPMTFTGTGGQFFVLCLVNGLLTIITLGIYWPWAACRISEWKARNTLVDGKPSGFVGRGGSLFFFSLIHFFILPALTFGLYYFYAMYRYYAWKQEHFRYGGAKTSFGAGFWGLMQIYLVIVVILILLPAVGVLVNLRAMEWLSPLICLFVSPWLICMFFNWETRGMVVGDEEGVKHFPPVKTRFVWVIILILVGVFVMAAAALFVKDRLGKQISEVGDLSRLFDMKGDARTKTGSVRGLVKQPTAPAPEKTPSPRAPAAGPADSLPPQKRAAEEPLVPVWTPPAEEPPPSSGDYEREIRNLDAFIEKDGQKADAYYSRGCLHARMGELENAEKDFTRAIEINNRNSDAYYNRGLVLVRMEKFDLAVKDFDDAIERNPHAADVYCNRGSAYFQLGKMDLAMKDYAKALEMKPDDPDLYYNRGLVHLSKGLKAEAKADFKKATALSLQPSSRPVAEKGVKPGVAKPKKIEGKELSMKQAADFDKIDIRNVPIAPFLDEVKDKIDVLNHPTYQKMARARDSNRQFVDPFYFERDSGKTPAYEFRQFTSTRNMQDIIEWYKKKTSPGLDGTEDAFARAGGSYTNGPFDNTAANFGVNNGHNFIVLTTMKAPEDDRATVYLFHYRKAPAHKPASSISGSKVG